MSETFTKEQLAERLRTGRWSKRAVNNEGPTIRELVSALLAQIERAEKAEAERDELFEAIEAWDGDVPAEAWSEVEAYNAAVLRARERGK